MPWISGHKVFSLTVPPEQQNPLTQEGVRNPHRQMSSRVQTGHQKLPPKQRLNEGSAGAPHQTPTEPPPGLQSRGKRVPPHFMKPALLGSNQTKTSLWKHKRSCNETAARFHPHEIKNRDHSHGNGAVRGSKQTNPTVISERTPANPQHPSPSHVCTHTALQIPREAMKAHSDHHADD